MTGGRRSSRPDRRRRAAVLAAAGYVCQLQLPGCTGVATEDDHLVALVDRPDLDDDPANHVAACRSCNRRKGAARLVRAPSVPSAHWQL